MVTNNNVTSNEHENMIVGTAEVLTAFFTCLNWTILLRVIWYQTITIRLRPSVNLYIRQDIIALVWDWERKRKI